MDGWLPTSPFDECRGLVRAENQGSTVVVELIPATAPPMVIASGRLACPSGRRHLRGGPNAFRTGILLAGGPLERSTISLQAGSGRRQS